MGRVEGVVWREGGGEVSSGGSEFGLWMDAVAGFK